MCPRPHVSPHWREGPRAQGLAAPGGPPSGAGCGPRPEQHRRQARSPRTGRGVIRDVHLPRRSCGGGHRGLRRTVTRPRSRPLAANCHGRCPSPRHSLVGFPASCGGAAAKSSRLRRAAGTSGTGSSDPRPAAPLPLLPPNPHPRVRRRLERSSAAGLPRKGFRRLVRQRPALALAYGTAEC